MHPLIDDNATEADIYLSWYGGADGAFPVDVYVKTADEDARKYRVGNDRLEKMAVDIALKLDCADRIVRKVIEAKAGYWEGVAEAIAGPSGLADEMSYRGL